MFNDSAFVIVSGQWFPVANAGTVNLTVRENKIESFALNGERRLLVPENSSGARSWEVNCSPVPAKWADSVGVLKTLSDRGTVVSWVPPLARYSNMLFQSWANNSRSIRTAGGYLGEAGSGSGSASSGLAPVRPGDTYMFSVCRDGSSGTAKGEFLDSTGTKVVSSFGLSNADDVRLSGSKVAPVGAAYARVSVSSGQSFFAPAVSMGESLNPYSLPGSCQYAVVSFSSVQHGRLRSSRSFAFTVREV